MTNDNATAASRPQSTVEVSGITGARGIVVAVLGTLLVVLLTNAAAVWLLRHSENDLIIRKWNLLLNMQAPVDWLILGDSAGNQGVVPRVLAEQFNTTAINLATHGGMGALDDAWMLGKYIEQFGPPESVLIVHTYDSWHLAGNPSSWAKVPFEWGFWGRVDPPVKPGRKQRQQMFLERYAPLYFRAKSLSRFAKPPLRTWNDSKRFQQDGLMVTHEPDPVFVQYNSKLEQHFVKDRKFQLHPLNRHALQTIRLLAEKHGFDVFIANAPLYDKLAEDSGFQAYFAQVVAELDKIVSKSDRLYFIAREPMTFEDDKLQSVDHLIYPAALVYTQVLVSEIETLRRSYK
jgi:hypothetical protein